MGQPTIERLRDYLGQLPPKAQAVLMREFERAIERGEDVAVANFVIEQLRSIVRAPSEDATPRTADPMRLLFRPLEPFLVENTPSIRPGQIRRSSLAPVWMWCAREGIPDDIRKFEAALAHPPGTPDIDRVTRATQIAVSEVIAKITAPGPDRQRLGRLGAPSVVEDIGPIGGVLRVREALDTLGIRLQGYMREFEESQVRSVLAALNMPSLESPQILPFALSLVMQRLGSPWQIIRLGISVAGSDDEVRIAGTPLGVTVTMAIHDLSRVTSELRGDIKRGQYKNIINHLKTLHDGVRGLRTELDFRTDSNWGRQLAAIRSDISNGMKSEIDGVPGRVRRLLRQGPDKDVTANSKIDPTEVDETAALIEFVAVCRNYASELAINEVTLRSFTELQQYVETATENLVESLRTTNPAVRAFRKMQMQAAIRFCDVLFGPDYAMLMSKAADMARPGERKTG
ncbi:MAG: hypothetical protein AB1342_10625 [Pseudomonadota bacterium]